MPKQLLFTAGAHYLLFGATKKALECRSGVVLTQFILLVLLELEDCPVCQALQAFGVDLQELVERLRLNPPIDTERVEQYGPLPQSYQLKFIVQAAFRLAERQGARRVAIEDIIVAYLAHNGAAAQQYLRNWITAEELAGHLHA